jgi:signal transduction histidine kinase
MARQMGGQLDRLVVVPIATMGVLAALLMWEAEHVGSVLLALFVALAAVIVALLVAKRVRTQIDELSSHYESLLRTAEEQSSRAEAAARIRDEFLSTLSHELRTPLNSILGWSRLLAGGKLDPEHTTRAIQAIERAGWAQSHMIEDLLDLSRIMAGRLRISTRATLVQPLLEVVVQSLEPAATAKQIAVETRADPSIGPVGLDPDRLQQIAWHLVSNAIKFTPAGGQVFVSLDRRDHDVCLSVSDNGVGFETEAGPLLFERFRQADSSSTRSYGGLGLGLGIVRHLVELHGGTVAAHSGGQNRGSTFEVRLPMRAVSGYSPEPHPPIEPEPLLRGVSVLVVDDDPSAREFVRSSLEHFGAIVRTAASAAEARDRFDREPPDVLLSDIRMPDADGIALIHDIREIDRRHGRHTPAAAFTALVRTEDRRRALEAGYQMHVAKPIDPFELAVAVEQLTHAD